VLQLVDRLGLVTLLIASVRILATTTQTVSKEKKKERKRRTCKMRLILNLVLLSLLSTTLLIVMLPPQVNAQEAVQEEQEETRKLTFALVSGGSTFFEPVQTGWETACQSLGIETCLYIVPNEMDFDYDTHVHPCVYEVRKLIALKQVDGISARCAYEATEIFQEARDAGIETVVFDQPSPPPPPGEEEVEVEGGFDGAHRPSAYIGTDNRFMGRTMARLLRQLRPEGGTFGFVHRLGDALQDQRIAGFEEEMTKDNDREERSHWYRVGADLVQQDDGVGALDRIKLLAALEPTAIIFTFQTPMRRANYTQTIHELRHLNITFIGTDVSDYQLAFLNRRYVDGLVGQLPYDMGARSAEILYDLVVQKKKPLEKTFFLTNLVAYNLIPVELPELKVDQNLLGNLVYIGYTCFGVVVVSCLACMAWTMYHCQSMVVRAAQPFFLMMTATGVLIMSGSLIPLSFNDGGAPLPTSRSIGICMSIPWLAFMGFTITFSALFSKTWRVNSLFHSSANFGRIVVSERDVLMPFAILLTCSFVVLICWTMMDPLTYERVYTDGTDYWNRKIESYGSCRSDHVAAYLTSLALSK
jgi:gamma-aminobutyric acid type B receptor